MRRVATILCLALLTIAAAGGCSHAREAPIASPPAVPEASASAPGATTTAATGVPDVPYIALCLPGRIDFVDPSTGAPLSSLTFEPIGSSGGFTPMRHKDVSIVGPSRCQDYSFNHDFTRVAGLTTHNTGDVVPASMDLRTSAVTDAVQPPDHSGFAATPKVYYIDAEFNPFTGDLWYVRNLDAGCAGEELIGPSFQRVISQDTVCGTDLDDPGQDPLIVFHDPGSTVPDVVSTGATKYESYYLDTIDLPKTDFGYSRVRRSDGGTAGAFVAYDAHDTTKPAGLYTVPAGGGMPTKVADLPYPSSSPPQVIRYRDR